MTIQQTIQSEIDRLTKVQRSLTKTHDMSTCMFTKELLSMEVAELGMSIKNLTEALESL